MLRTSDAERARSALKIVCTAARAAASTDALADVVFVRREAVRAHRQALDEERAGKAHEENRAMYERRACGV